MIRNTRHNILTKAAAGLTAFIIISGNTCLNAFAGVKAVNTPPPSIYGKAGITVDMKTGEIIYANNVDKRMYPASTTKLLTALLLAENKKKSDILKYTEEAKKQPAYSLNLNMHPLRIGEGFSADGAMDALLLYSANDVAYMIADNVSGTSKDFSNLMNKTIQSFGLKNTHYITPNGLHNPNHYTTPYDLSVIGRKAFENQWVRDTLTKQKSTIVTTKGTKLLLDTRNKILGQNYCIGGKTGYTSKAGRCLVAFFNKDGRKLMGVVMHSLYDSKDSFVFNDMKKIINWSYAAHKTIIYKKGTVVATVPVSYKQFLFFGRKKTLKVPLKVNKDVGYYDNYINQKELKKEITTNVSSAWSIKNSKPAGTLTLKEREAKEGFALYPSVKTGAIFMDNAAIYSGIIAGFAAFIILVIFIIVKIRKRRNRNYFY